MELICPTSCNWNTSCIHRKPHKETVACFNYSTSCKVVCVDSFLYRVKEAIKKEEENDRI